jgi:hypothetical protein
MPRIRGGRAVDTIGSRPSPRGSRWSPKATSCKLSRGGYPGERWEHKEKADRISERMAVRRSGTPAGSGERKSILMPMRDSGWDQAGPCTTVVVERRVVLFCDGDPSAIDCDWPIIESFYSERA